MQELKLKLITGEPLKIRYHRSMAFSGGSALVCDNNVVYQFYGKNDWPKANRIRDVERLQYGSEEMKKTVQSVLPMKWSMLEDDKHKPIVVIRKETDCYPLDVVEGGLNSKDFDTVMMWSISRMIKLSCVLKVNNIVYGGFQPQNLMIWASGHSIFLPGGWWDTVEMDDGNKNSDIKDIKVLAKNYFSGGAYKYVRRWCEEPPAGDAFEELKAWDEAVDESVGKREFVPLVIDPETAYG